jgi:hypothetical protein
MKPISMNRGMIACITMLTVAIMAVESFSQDPNFFIFLAFGQSNMEGFPKTQQHQDSIGIPTRFQLLPAVDWPDKSRTKGVWTAAIPPLCRGDGPGLCPCDYFGRTLADSLPSSIKIGVINVSVAGCQIEMFDKDRYQTYLAQSGTADWLRAIANTYGGNPYARLVEMGKLAQKDGVIKGFLLHQGESGSMTGQWANEVKTIYYNLIKDLNLDSTKTPLLAGDLAGGGSNDVKNLPKTLKYAHVVSSLGIEVGSAPHFSSKGYRDFGKRYADTMLNILGKITDVAGKKASVGYNAGYSLETSEGMASISFEIPRFDFVTIDVCALNGKKIAALAGSKYQAGKHTIAFGRNTIPEGVFVLRMKSGAFTDTRRIMITEH